MEELERKIKCKKLMFRYSLLLPTAFWKKFLYLTQSLNVKLLIKRLIIHCPKIINSLSMSKKPKVMLFGSTIKLSRNNDILDVKIRTPVLNR